MEADSARIYIIDETAADDSRTERLIRLARLYAAEEAMPLPQTLCIAKGEYGKPYFENAPWLHFSVSHSPRRNGGVLFRLDGKGKLCQAARHGYRGQLFAFQRC